MRLIEFVRSLQTSTRFLSPTRGSKLGRRWFSTRRTSGWKRGCAVLLFCAATTIGLPAQTLTALVDFNGTDGATPAASLIEGFDGNLYGTTAGGGAYGQGTIFKMTLGGTLTTLYSFCVQANCPDGQAPNQLTQGADGNFYGTTQSGGAYNAPFNGNLCPAGCGTVFKITAQGSLTTLHSFCSTPTTTTPMSCADGNLPLGPLVQATDGNFYGVTLYGGAAVYDFSGTVYKITPQGVFTILYSFCANETACSDGSSPVALFQATDGSLYGASGGGNGAIDGLPSGYGTIFKITLGGTLTTLYKFCAQNNCPDGAGPERLIQATGGNLYGITGGGGGNQAGTVFEITTGGELTTLYSFCPQGFPNCADGLYPQDSLDQASDGNFYGVTRQGGTRGYGTVFKVTPGGTLSTLYSFCAQSPCPEGFFPESGLTQATDGNFYGSTPSGGLINVNDGAIFRLSVGLNPPSPVYSLQVSAPTPGAISPGGSAQSAVSVVPANLYSGSVTLSCSVSPAVNPAPTCSFGSTSPVSVSGGAGSATLTFMAIGPSAGVTRARELLYALLLPIPGLALINAGFRPRGSRRRLLGLLVLWVMLACLIVVPACGGGGGSGGGGGGGNSGTPAGTYTITITGSDASGAAQTSAIPTVTVVVN
jgi:uncharacterized repeat protein (TIGR03803 family)